MSSKPDVSIPLEYLDRGQAAQYLKLSPTTLAIWACRGRGPALIKAGRRVLYHKPDLDRWALAQRRMALLVS